ncbi:MAG: dihydrofolate reductase [Saprospiraceae bacterium]|nr:dihydrofolate reductase [Saprospiraceae bacterium]
MKEKYSIVTIHMVSSIDGFIAKKDGDVSWMKSSDHFDKGIELTNEIIAGFLDKIDCYVMGSKTYEDALKLGWPYGHKPVYVLTERNLVDERETVHFHNEDPSFLINDKLRRQFQNIWMVGGSQLTKAFLQHNLADEIIVTWMPIILGDGMLFFDFIGKEIPLHLKEVTAFKDGMVELTYDILRD